MGGHHAVAFATPNGTTNTTAVNSTSVNATSPAANVTQIGNATLVQVTTPSGTIHIVYVSNTTKLVINYNKHVITANLKTVIYNGTTAYYVHVVGHALGTFNSTYVAQTLQKVVDALKSGNTTLALDYLKQLAAYVANNNATKKAELNIMLAARSLNATAPNATYLRAKIEYELKKGLKQINGTSSELEVHAFASNLSQLASFLNALSKELQPYNPSDAAQLAEVAKVLNNITIAFKELELKLANGTQIEIHKTGHGYKIEVHIGGEHHEKDHEEHKGAAGSGEDHEKHNKAGEHHDEDHSKAGAGQGNSHNSGSSAGSSSGNSDEDNSTSSQQAASSGDQDSGSD
ncbi:hypothetical protein TTX_0222 [Thermoproteus tenax Kra 1]|uniref:Uncharacterized protein n=2 Tax=Thermoproteus tenax TaxID=2271 RepID=G4RMV7_THETK|nr:hypothetical protein TTX_0222 [Thermoproteus tenax Kra 1]